MEDIYKFVQNFKDKLELDSPDNLNWHYRFYEKNNHFTNAIEIYMDGLILYFNSNNAKLR